MTAGLFPVILRGERESLLIVFGRSLKASCIIRLALPPS